jgi:hypothetical protein
MSSTSQQSIINNICHPRIPSFVHHAGLVLEDSLASPFTHIHSSSRSDISEP